MTYREMLQLDSVDFRKTMYHALGWRSNDEPLEIVARRLRDETPYHRLRASAVLMKLSFGRCTCEGYALTGMECYAMATPKEQIVCCLLALGFLGVEK